MKNVFKISIALLATALTGCASTSENGTAEIPVIGCPADGQAEAIPAPANSTRTVQINPTLAHKLEFYQMDSGPIVLSPRGWHCFGLSGSNGESLFLTPRPLNAAMVRASSWRIKGDGIQISKSFGDTSGRFTVADIAARVFPSQKAYVQSVIDEFPETANDFPSGVYPDDEITYINDMTITYKTPARAKGLGTRSRLETNGDPITGAAILNGLTPDLTMLAVRIGKTSNDVTDAIIHQAIQDAMMDW